MGSGAVYRVSLGIGRTQYKGDEDPRGQLVVATRILMTAPGVTTNPEQLSDCHLERARGPERSFSRLRAIRRLPRAPGRDALSG